MPYPAPRCFFCDATDLAPANTLVNLTTGRIICKACRDHDLDAV